jgi:hypothetical protein
MPLADRQRRLVDCAPERRAISGEQRERLHVHGSKETSMAQDKDQLVGEDMMNRMSVAPPDPTEEATGPSGPSVSDRQRAASEHLDGKSASAPSETSGVADDDPLSAHPS